MCTVVPVGAVRLVRDVWPAGFVVMVRIGAGRGGERFGGRLGDVGAPGWQRGGGARH